MNIARLSLAVKFGVLLILAATFQCASYSTYGEPPAGTAAADRTGGEVDSPQSMFSLGMRYLRGEGVPTNQAAAAEWLRKAAEAGHIPAQSELGVLYENGWGVPRDIQTAALYYRTAAEASDGNGCYHLGHCYHEGAGVAQNDVQAAKWLRIAAEGGDPRAQRELAYLLLFGAKGVERNQKEASDLYRKSALQGDRRSMNNVSYCYETGSGVNASPDEAAEWCMKAALAGDDTAQMRLGLHFIDGAWPTVPKNPSAGVELLRKAAKQTNVTAMTHLAHCYESGTGVKLNRESAKEWYDKACDASGIDMIPQIAFQYLLSAESIEDYPRAIRWLDRAAAAGQSAACLMLADFYMNASEDIDLKALLQKEGLFDKVNAAFLFMEAAKSQYFPGETSASNQYAEATRLAPAYTNAAKGLVYDSKRISTALKRKFSNGTLPPELTSLGAGLILATNPPGSVMIGNQIVSPSAVTTNANGTVVTVIDVFDNGIPPEALERMPELTNATIYRPAVALPSNSIGNKSVIMFR